MKLNSIFMVFTFLILGSLSAQPKVDEQGRPIVSPIPVARPISGLAPESVPIPVPRPENLGREWHDVSDPEPGDADAALEQEQDFSGNPDGQADYSAELYQAVLEYEGTSTRDVPHTNNGTRACAWAANQVYNRVFGHNFGHDFGNDNYGLIRRTHELIVWLEEEVELGDAIEVDINDAKPGDLIISPSTDPNLGPRVIGHVGYIGEGDTIYSNSSFGRAPGDEPRFVQNYDRACWQYAFSGTNGSNCQDQTILNRVANDPSTWPKSLPTRVFRFLKDE